jgi:ABC-type glycerol-3-phosphate transport system substrate-binding protein
MSRLGKENILNIYSKNAKKSIYYSIRIDLFLIISLLILIISPLIIKQFIKLNTERKQKILLLSPQFEELFGEEITEILLQEFSKRDAYLRIQSLKLPEDKETVPDILIFDEGNYSSLIDEGILAKLKQSENENEKEQLAVPLVSFMPLLFYNIDILTAAGFDRPPKTRDEFIKYAKAVSDSNEAQLANTAGAAISLSPKDKNAVQRDIFSWIWASGGDFWQEGDSPVLNVKTISGDITFFGKLYNDKLLAYRIFETTGEQRLEDFADGKIAMMIAYTSVIPFLRERMGDNSFGITNIPGSGSAGKYNTGISSIYAGINVNCEYPDEAMDFIAFLEELRPLFCEMLKAVPGVVSDIITESYIRNDPFYSKSQDIFVSSAIVQGFSGKPSAEEYENAFLEELQIFLRSSRKAEDTITAIQSRWDEIFYRIK